MKNVLSILILFSFTSSAQVFEWVKTNPVQFNQNPSMVTSSICKAGNGMIFMARTDSVTFTFGSTAFGIFKIDLTDSAGNTVRTAQLGPKVTVHDIVADSAGNLFVAGSFMDTCSIDGQDTLNNSGGAFSVNPFLLCFDSTGTLQWKRNLSNGPLSIINLRTLSLAPSGDIYYATDDFGDGKIIRLDSMGNDNGVIQLNGAKTIGDFKFDPFGNIYVTGSTSFGSFSIGSFSLNVPEPYMIFIARINASGQATFIHLAHDITFQFPNVVTDENGNGYIAGNLSDTLSWGNITLQGPDWVYDFFLVKVDSTGAFQWAREVPNPTGGIVGDFYIASRKCLAYDPQGRILLAGNLRGSIDWGNGVLVNNAMISQSNLHLVAFDISGIAMWAEKITSSTFNEMHAVLHHQGNWYFTGSHNAATGVAFDTVTVDFNAPQNILLAKLNNNMTTGLHTSDHTKTPLLIYPNPSDGQVVLPKTWCNGAPVELYSVHGKFIGEQLCNSGQLDLRNLVSGCYILKRNHETIRLVIH